MRCKKSTSCQENVGTALGGETSREEKKRNRLTPFSPAALPVREQDARAHTMVSSPSRLPRTLTHLRR